MDFLERFKKTGGTLSGAVFDQMTMQCEEKIIALVAEAVDTANLDEELAYDAAVGAAIRKSLEEYVELDEDADEPEEMYGNHAYDAIAKDRASGY